MREYQVPIFTSGTHPHMTTSGSGGFIFHATTVFNEGVEIVKQQPQKRIKQDTKNK
jgi:hypothetical protein